MNSRGSSNSKYAVRGNLSRSSRRLSWLLALSLCSILNAQNTPASSAAPFVPKVSPEALEAYRKAADEKLHTDWADLEKYRDANMALPAASVAGPRVVFLGDSVTEYWGQKGNPVFPDLGDFFPDRPYINRGISGQTTPQMLVRFRQDVIDLKPAIVVLLAGTNDIAGNTGPMTLEQTEQNIRTMAELARFHGISVILCSVTPAKVFWWNPSVAPNPRIRQLNAWIKSYADDNHLRYVDYYDALVDTQLGMKSTLSPDGVHPNGRGYALMAPLVEQAIQATLSQHPLQEDHGR
jgi:lysophospholipase L1-like esterase